MQVSNYSSVIQRNPTESERLPFLASSRNALFRLGYSTLGRNCLSILIYHSVLDAPDFMRPGVPTAEQFRWEMQLLRDNFNMLPLSQAIRLMREGRLPPRAACVTFDDGYADNLKVATPIMKQLDIPATFFIATGFLDGGRMWNDTVIEGLRHCPDRHLDLSALNLPVYEVNTPADRVNTAYDIISKIKYLDEGLRNEIAAAIGSISKDMSGDLMLTRDQVRELRQSGMEIGGHTVNHPILARLSAARSREEILSGKEDLESIIQERLGLFAYPNGRYGADYSKEHVEYVREAGFDAAVTTNGGVSEKSTNLYELPRFTPWDRTASRFLLRMTLNARHRG
ncbi:MAG: polysaccharide deacetylase family protein [Gammaproteobacteria bacterium]|nr:polysaccharide deacetylase family protein [Pseudomonadales bacterium]